MMRFQVFWQVFGRTASRPHARCMPFPCGPRCLVDDVVRRCAYTFLGRAGQVAHSLAGLLCGGGRLFVRNAHARCTAATEACALYIIWRPIRPGDVRNAHARCPGRIHLSRMHNQQPIWSAGVQNPRLSCALANPHVEMAHQQLLAPVVQQPSASSCGSLGRPAARWPLEGSDRRGPSCAAPACPASGGSAPAAAMFLWLR